MKAMERSKQNDACAYGVPEGHEKDNRQKLKGMFRDLRTPTSLKQNKHREVRPKYSTNS